MEKITYDLYDYQKQFYNAEILTENYEKECKRWLLDYNEKNGTAYTIDTMSDSVKDKLMYYFRDNFLEIGETAQDYFMEELEDNFNIMFPYDDIEALHVTTKNTDGFFENDNAVLWSFEELFKHLVNQVFYQGGCFDSYKVIFDHENKKIEVYIHDHDGTVYANIVQGWLCPYCEQEYHAHKDKYTGCQYCEDALNYLESFSFDQLSLFMFLVEERRENFLFYIPNCSRYQTNEYARTLFNPESECYLGTQAVRKLLAEFSYEDTLNEYLEEIKHISKITAGGQQK